MASGNGKGQIFVKGQVIATVPEDLIVPTLIAEANKLADEFAHSGRRGRSELSTTRRSGAGRCASWIRPTCPS